MTSAKKLGRSRNTIGISEENKDTDAAGKPDATHVPNEDRYLRISEAAYHRAERRGFVPGHEQDDWLEAEKEIDGQETNGPVRPNRAPES